MQIEFNNFPPKWCLLNIRFYILDHAPLYGFHALDSNYILTYSWGRVSLQNAFLLKENVWMGQFIQNYRIVTNESKGLQPIILFNVVKDGSLKWPNIFFIDFECQWQISKNQLKFFFSVWGPSKIVQKLDWNGVKMLRMGICYFTFKVQTCLKCCILQYYK